MTKYHINPETGRAGQCKAQSAESCKFSIESGTVVAHYETKDEAKAAYEKLNQNRTLNSVKKVSKTSQKEKIPTLQENRTKLSKINSKVRQLNKKVQDKKFKLMDLNKSLSLDKSKEERDEIYENIKNENENILILDKQRKNAIEEQRELAQTIEKQQRQEPKQSENKKGTGYQDHIQSFNERFFSDEGGPCGGARAC